MKASLPFVLPPALSHARRNLPQAHHHQSAAPVAARFLCHRRPSAPRLAFAERARWRRLENTNTRHCPSAAAVLAQSQDSALLSRAQAAGSHAVAQPQSTRSFQVSIRRFAPSALVCFAIQVKTQIQSKVAAQRARPNPSIERTRNGMAHFAFISFWAKRAIPPRSAHVKR